MSPSFHVLAESHNFVLGHSYESVVVIRRADSSQLVAGEHYGDPKVGLISPNEEWFVTGGEGLLCYSVNAGLQSFFRQGCPPLPAGTQVQYWPVHSARFESESVVRVLIDPWSEHASVWELNLNSGFTSKLGEGPHLHGQPYRDVVLY
jgi:hypothetical protein